LTRVIFIRHGETDWNKARRIQGGNSDTPLNELGQQQAEKLALGLKKESIQAIYASPLQRARDTAQAIARYHQLPVSTLLSLREIDTGELEGVTIAEVGQHLSQLLTTQIEGAELPAMPGGESLTTVQRRVWRTIQRLASRYNEGTLVIVSHYFAILTAVCAVLNLPLSYVDRLRISPGSITVVTFDEPVARLTRLNDTCHLS
jgi:probable phosphoglycerate mutase